MDKKYDGYQPGAAEMRYEELKIFREPFLMRARQCSELTIPALIPPDGWTGTSELYTPFQSVGARGVNNLASKLLLTLLPANTPFFRYRVEEYALEQMNESKNIKTKVETGLAKMEKAIVTEIETTASRVPTFEGLKHLIVGGNILFYLPTKGALKVFHLSRYVVKRDPMGNVLEIVVKEDVSPKALPANIRDLLYKSETPANAVGADDKTCGLFTYVKRVDGSWKVYQEIKGKVIPDSRGTYPLDKSPWMPLRFTVIDGEDYGRGYCEEYLGDLRSLEGLAQAIVEGSAAMAKTLFLVKPNGTTTKKDLAEAQNGAIVAGDALDVSVLRVEKHADFTVAANTAQKIEQRLAMAFLLNSAIQRDGERVTAEEIRLMAKDLEDALGGIYSILSQEFQLPYVTRLQMQMQKAGRLPRLPKGIVRPSIVTGIEALGRGHDRNKLVAFLQGAVAALGPEAVVARMNVGEFLDRLATADGIDPKGLIKTEEELAAESQQMQRQQMMQQFGPELMKTMGGIMQEKMKNGGSIEDMVKGMGPQAQARAQQAQAAQQNA